MVIRDPSATNSGSRRCKELPNVEDRTRQTHATSGLARVKPSHTTKAHNAKLSRHSWLVTREPDFLAPLAGEEVDAVDEAHPVAARAHDERVRAARSRRGSARRAAGRRSRRPSRRRSPPGREVVDREDAVDVLDPVLGAPPRSRCATSARAAPAARRRGSAARRPTAPPGACRRCRSRGGRSCRGSRRRSTPSRRRPGSA